MPETLKEIEAEDLARRERAWKYERLTSEVFRLKKMVTSLETKREELKPSCDALAEISALASKVAEGVATTRGSNFLPGGFDIKLILTHMVERAHADLAAKVKTADNGLKKVKAELEQAEARLAEFV